MDGSDCGLAEKQTGEVGDMDEHEWERFLRQCDARTERFGELMDKFMDHPDRECIIAEEMGWNHLIEALDADEPVESDENQWHESVCNELEEDWREPDPDPKTEGVDWIRTEHGRIVHPLQHRCFDLGIRMFHDAQKMGLLGPDVENPDESVDLMKFKIHCTSAKLAGSLNSLAFDYEPEAGFIVANLKRALKLVNEALGAIALVEKEGKILELIPEYRRETFEIRSGIIDLIDRYRSK